MHESLDRETVLRLLEELRRKDSKRGVFGAAEHGYTLNPPIPLSTIEGFEARHGIRLPEDYRHFITAIGNGGVGPYYGLFPFGQQDDSVLWEEGDLIGDVSQPFPHVEAWNLPDSFFEQEPDIPPDAPAEEEDRLWEEWDRVEQEHYWNPSIMNGAIPICHMGCALRQWLVIHGDQKGFVWNDCRADQRGISPLLDESGRQMTFTDWYRLWMNKSIWDASVTGKVVELLSRGRTSKATEFYMEQTGAEPSRAERAIKMISLGHGIGRRNSRLHDLGVALALIILAVLFVLVLALWRR